MIRAFGAGDAAAVADLDAALFGHNAWSREAWAGEALGDRRDRGYLVLEQGERVVGYAGIMRSGSDADVVTVAVAPAHQRLGHGRVLVLELLEIARRWGCMAVFLEVEQDNAAALALYRSMGFVPVGERRHYYGTGRHAVTMRCRLREPMGSLPLDGGAP